mgnify:FL=1
MPAQPNYTAEMTALVVDQYQNGTPIEDISEMVTRSVRSVRSKLVREGVYVAAAKPTAAKRDNGPTKKELLIQLESSGWNVQGLEGATKDAIKALIAHFEQ